MITKKLLKEEIDKVPDEHLGVLYRIVRALEEPPQVSDVEIRTRETSWQAWIADTYGSTAEAPIERGDQGSNEVREPLE